MSNTLSTLNVKHTPHHSRELNEGTQHIFLYDNGFGASVVKHQFSYGGSNDLWELAVLQYDGVGNKDEYHSWPITYNTPITDDVEGNLRDQDVQRLLTRIKRLKPIGPDALPRP